MLIGCCTNMLATEEDSVGRWAVPAIAEAGFDYLDLPVAQMMELSDGDFHNLVREVDASGLNCLCCNNFIPAELRLTGIPASGEQIAEYLERSLERVAELDSRLLCFGSSGARNVPDGFSLDEAWNQIVSFLRLAGEAADRRGITIVIEHLNRGESNIVNSVAEGIRLSREVDHPAVKVLADYYHLILENESSEIVTQAGSRLLHCHIANPEARVFPKPGDGQDYEEFFRHLRNIAYTGGISLEAFTDDFLAEAAETCAYLKQLAIS